MPTRRPVVNGTDSRPASSSTRSRTAGSLSGEPKWASPFSVNSRVEVVSSIIPIEGDDRLEPVHLLPRHHAGVQVREQSGLLEHPDRHRADVGQRRVVALLVEPLPGLGPAVLGPVAEGEQRLQAAELRHPDGRCRGSRRARGTARRWPCPRAGDPACHERAVVAPVPAQPGDRDEHLRGVGDDCRAPGRDQSGVADPGGGRAQSRSSVSPRAASRAAASATSRAAPRSARASARRTCWGGASPVVSLTVQSSRAWTG